jgi:hypothetical protein
VSFEPTDGFRGEVGGGRNPSGRWRSTVPTQQEVCGRRQDRRGASQAR